MMLLIAKAFATNGLCTAVTVRIEIGVVLFIDRLGDGVN